MSQTCNEHEVTNMKEGSVQLETESKKDVANKETVDKMHFKAVARQKFDAVLKHEINSRRTNSETGSGVRGGGPSQCFRIENAKIFSVNDASIKADAIKDSIMSDITNVESKLLLNNTESTKNFLTSKASRDTEGHVFIYDPILVSADSLNYMGAEANRVNSSSNKQDHFLDNRCVDDNTDTHPDSVFRCFLCPYFHVQEMMVARHWIQTHLSHNVYLCPYCRGSFLTNYLAMKHIVDVHPNEPIKIEIQRSNQFAVKLSFDQKNSLGLQTQDKPPSDLKEKSNTTYVSVKCHKCSLECKSIADLEEHHKHVHIHFRPYSCGMCNSRICFATRIDLEHHIKITHPNVVKETSIQTQDVQRNKEVEYYIDWSQTCIVSDKGKMIKCKWCDFQTTFTKEMCQHALKVHNWSKFIKCPKCNTPQEMKDEDYKIGKVTCLHCYILININHDMNGTNALVSSTTMYKCIPCDYQTASKGSICRHLKYSHSKCRPFCCPYCSYAAVERPKVRSHILSLHPGKEIKPTEKLERSAAFKKSFDELFRRFVKTEKVEFFKNAFSGELKIMTNKFQNTSNRNTFFECGACKFTSDNLEDAKVHIRSCHQEDVVKPEVKEYNTSVIFGEHFRCVSCNYKCLDRSCMARHVKYKHLTSRPHQCPHCPYNNVEKTKVRLHIGSNHPLLHNHVSTNQHLLEQMSVEAKKFYIRVDANGREYSEGGHASDANKQKIIVNFSKSREKVKIIETKRSEDLKVPDEQACVVVTKQESIDDVPLITNEIDESIDNLSDLGQSFSGSLEGDEDVDLNENSALSSDEDMLSNDQSQEDNLKNRIPEVCIDNLVVEPYILEDPKISKQVPVVHLKDFVIIDDDVDNLIKTA